MHKGYNLGVDGVLIPSAVKQVVDEFRHVADIDIAIAIHIPLDVDRKKGHSASSAKITAIGSKDLNENTFQ